MWLLSITLLYKCAFGSCVLEIVFHLLLEKRNSCGFYYENGFHNGFRKKLGNDLHTRFLNQREGTCVYFAKKLRITSV